MNLLGSKKVLAGTSAAVAMGLGGFAATLLMFGGGSSPTSAHVSPAGASDTISSSSAAASTSDSAAPASSAAAPTTAADAPTVVVTAPTSQAPVPSSATVVPSPGPSSALPLAPTPAGDTAIRAPSTPIMPGPVVTPTQCPGGIPEPVPGGGYTCATPANQ